MILMIAGNGADKVGGMNEAWTKAEIARVLTLLEPELIVVGLARGSEVWAAQLALSMDIPFEAYLPNPDHTRRWSAEDRSAAQHVLEYAERTIYACPTNRPSAFLMRNQLMAQVADTGLIVWDGQRGRSGTFHALRMLQVFHKPFIHINPVNHTTRALHPRPRQPQESSRDRPSQPPAAA